MESGNDLGDVSAAVIDAARDVASEPGLDEPEAAVTAVAGMLSAAETAGPETLNAVREWLPAGVTELDGNV